MPERLRVSVLILSQDRQTALLNFPELGREIHVVLPVIDYSGCFQPDALYRTQTLAGRVQNFPGATEVVDEATHPYRPDPWQHIKCDKRLTTVHKNSMCIREAPAKH